MTFNSIRLSVHKALLQKNFSKYDSTEENNVNKILTGCLVLHTVQKIISADSKNAINAEKYIEEYINTFKNISENLKNKFISYKLIYNKITQSKIENFLRVDQKFVNEIIKLYENKEMVKPFSSLYFSQNMYNITNLSDYKLKNLEFSHTNVITPIIKYYSSILNIQYDQVYLEMDEHSYSGKSIYLSIKDISNSRILSDLEKDVFNIKQYVYNYSISPKKFIKIIIK